MSRPSATPSRNDVLPILKIDGPGAHPTRGRSWLLLTLAAFAFSRTIYLGWYGVRFDVTPLDSYFQLIDEQLLKTRLLESVFYLRDQPPLFNLAVGLLLQLFPNHFPTACQALSLTAGALLTASLFALLHRLGVAPPLAAGCASAFAIHPATVLLENWLMYEHPITCLLTPMPLLLHRYLTDGRRRDALLFFSLAAALVLTRGTFHWLWFLLLMIGALIASPGARRRTLRSAALPAALVAAFYLKNALLFGEPLSGEVYRKLNLHMMTVDALRPDLRDELMRSGHLSPVSNIYFYTARPADYSRWLPELKATGVSLLDLEAKANGRANWHHQSWPHIAELYARDARVVQALYPGVYWSSVWENAKRYFVPAWQTYPFNRGAHPNASRLEALLEFTDRWVSGQLEYGEVGWINLIAMAAALTYGLSRCAGPPNTRAPDDSRGPASITRGRRHTADRAVFAFMLFNISYAAAVTILFSHGDHNRYRFAVMPLYVVIMAFGAGAAARFGRFTLMHQSSNCALK